MSTATSVEEKVVVSLQPPKLWKVVFLNDDQTPMELVIELLTGIFKHTEVYPFEIAEQKGLEATNVARKFGAPLRIQVEEE
jgi:ATP-dependent Clp protease adapter protein ClpS